MTIREYLSFLMERNLNTHNLIYFCAGWLIIWSSYSFTKFTLKGYATNEEPVPLWHQIGLYVIALCVIGMGSFTVYLFTMDFSDPDNIIERVKWFDIFIPMLVPSLFVIFITIRKRNKYLYEMYSKEYFKIK